ncbi:hypothetical protein LTR37_005357 [Vermiconidia calcicola]|uniref:Uncharacterized protein n=1 Tax=Vermiconidia calcicola TaxID=1690605 RepID=A0ACC3NIW2_9PEZI|nr:hypothetical protein LTR37_005357 [Vermiconidia calcicola]
MSAEDTVRIRRGQPNGEICNVFLEKMKDYALSMPEGKTPKGPAIGSKDSARPLELPEGSVFLYAETGTEDEPIAAGSVALIPLRSTSPHFKGLPNGLETVGEVKRMIVLEEHRRKGIALKLMRAVEEVAKDEMGWEYIAVETWWSMKAAQVLYEKAGYRRSEPWGAVSMLLRASEQIAIAGETTFMRERCQAATPSEKMTLQRFALDYRGCTVKELRGFLEARTGELPTNTRTAKRYYINRLWEADSVVSFRFLDLAPELRNNIYRELLTLRSVRGHSERRCWTGILRASKQICEEAHGILYGENDFDIIISGPFRPAARGGYYRLVYSDLLNMTYEENHKLGQVILNWPNYLRKVQRLRLTINIHYDNPRNASGPSPVFKVINYTVYSICSFVVEQNHLKRLQVQVQTQSFSEFGAISHKVLWPLAKLTSATDCKIIGISEDAQQRLHQEMQRNDPNEEKPVNALVKAHKLVARANELKDIMTEVAGLAPRKDAVSKLLAPVHAVLNMDGYVDAQHDAGLVMSVDALEEELNGPWVGEVKTKVEKRMARLADFMKAFE